MESPGAVQREGDFREWGDDQIEGEEDQVNMDACESEVSEDLHMGGISHGLDLVTAIIVTNPSVTLTNVCIVKHGAGGV